MMGHSVTELLGKIKDLGRKFVEPRNASVILIILACFASFGLGRLSVLNSYKKGRGILIKEPFVLPASAVAVSGALEGERETRAEKKSVLPSVTNSGGQVVASKNGSKYHFPWCAGAKQISEQNKIYFDSAEAARAKGYMPAANCKGLK